MVYMVAALTDDEHTECSEDAGEANCRHWVRERSQRDQMQVALKAAGAAARDVVLVSDLDELLPRSAVEALARCRTPLPLTLPSELFFYSFRWRVDRARGAPFVWYHPQAAEMQQLTRAGMTASKLRSYGSDVALFRRLVGWHCSYFGGVRAIRHKLRAYTHQEMNVPEVTDEEHIDQCIRHGQTLSKVKPPSRGSISQTLPDTALPPHLGKRACVRACVHACVMPGTLALSMHAYGCMHQETHMHAHMQVNRLNNGSLHDGALLTAQPSWALRRPLLLLEDPSHPLLSLALEGEAGAVEGEAGHATDGGGAGGGQSEGAMCLGCDEPLWIT